MGLVVRELALTVGADTGVLAVAGQPDEIIDVLGVWGKVPGHDDLPLSVADGFVGRVLSSGRAAVEPLDAEHDRILGARPSGTPARYGAGAGVRPPGGPDGALCVGFSGSPPPDPALTLWLVESYARLAAICLRDPGALDGLLQSARRDGLTGCLNHAAIHDVLAREIRRSDRHRLNISCCFIDLDNFKLVNERHGHLHGSQVLATVATALREGVRTDDTIGRYGGDEFIAVLPETDETAAVLLAERLRTRIAAMTRDDCSGQLDAAIGVAQWRPGSSPETMLAEADGALRLAKASGGGAVVRASALPGADEDAAPAQQRAG
jgi:diguanylate cyclase (GGDEF)-like protein